METGNIIFSAVITLLCIVPLVLLYVNRAGKAKKLSLDFLQKVKDAGYQISQSEIFGTWAIGLDEASKMFFYYKDIPNDPVFVPVHLAEMTECRISKNNKTLFTNNTSQEVIEKVGLSFTYRDKSKKEIVIPFFTLQEDMQLSGELQLAEKWQKILQGVIEG